MYKTQHNISSLVHSQFYEEYIYYEQQDRKNVQFESGN